MSKSALFAGILVALCLAGCGASTPAPAPADPATKLATGKNGSQGGNNVAGLNPNYHMTAAQDEARVGASLNKH
jgi:hypothetical protein